MQCQAISWNQGPFPASSPHLQEWFKDAVCHYRFIHRVLQGELDSLTEPECTQLLDFVSRNGTLHMLANHNAIEILLAKGANPNHPDEQGRSCLALADTPEAIKRLLKHGAKYVTLNGPFSTTLEFATAQIHSRRWGFEFISIIPFILEHAKDESLRSNANCFLTLLFFYKNHLEFARFLTPFVTNLCANEPQMAANVLITFFSSEKSASFSHLLPEIIKREILSREIMDTVLSHPAVFVQCVANRELFEKLEKILGSDFPFTYFLRALQSHKKLVKAAQFLVCLSHLKECLPTINESIKDQCVAHILELQESSKKFIWESFPAIHFEILLLLPQLGISPNWQDYTFHRNALFSEEVLDSGKVDVFIEATGVNCHHRDKYGKNALDLFCKDFPKRDHFVETVRTLTNQGLALTDFPNLEFCRSVFPHQPFHQTLLAVFLDLTDGPQWFKKMENKDKEILCDAALTSPMVHKKLDKLQRKKERPIPSLPEELRADSKLLEEVAPFLSYWENPIPYEAFTVVAECPFVSFVIATIQRRSSHNKKPIRPIHLFKDFSQNDVLSFINYLFNHPDFFADIYKNYFVISRIDYYQRGGLTDLSRIFVTELLFKMHSFKLQLGREAQKVHEAFREHLVVTPIETIPLEDKNLEYLGRTATLIFAEGRQAFKVKKPKENFHAFLQEYSVTKAFRKMPGFQTQFAEPIATYSTRKLSPASQEPSYLYHYKAEHDLFKYPQDLQNETEFDTALAIATNDATKMVLMQILPDMVPFYHDEEDGRKYFPLVDLMIYISGRYSSQKFSAAGGAGGLERPFEKLWKPNIRLAGLADLRDAVFLDGQECFSKELHAIPSHIACSEIFYQMHGLSNIILATTLLRLERYRANKTLNWQNDTFNKDFGEKLKATFIQLISSYTKRDKDECQAFASAIDWTTMAREIAFFSDNSENGYPTWVAKGKFPETLFQGIEVIVEAASAVNFNPQTGFNGNIGPFSGPLGWAEFEKMLKTLLIPVLLTQQPQSLHRGEECNPS